MARAPSPQAPKGTRDFYPEDMALQNHIFAVWRRTCESFGYREFEGPMFEHLELFTKKSGEEIAGQLYHFSDKGGRKLALRPEMTPTLARMILQKGPSLKLPARWYAIPRLFRYERMQRGRLREFYQLNMDILGAPPPWAEVDCIAAVVEMLRGFGLRDGEFTVGVSSRRVLQALFKNEAKSGQEALLYAMLDKLDKIPGADLREALKENAIALPGRALEEWVDCRGVDSLRGWAAQRPWAVEPVEELAAVLEALHGAGYERCVRFDPGVVRGLAYYTGVVFEVFDAGKDLRAIAGGGRYDDLVGGLGGKAMSGVGFGMGDVVLAELLKSRSLGPAPGGDVDFFVATLGPVDGGMWRLAKALRGKGWRVAYPLKDMKLSKQLSQAEGMGARKVIFYGSARAGEGTLEVKDMASGSQRVVSLEELAA